MSSGAPALEQTTSSPGLPEWLETNCASVGSSQTVLLHSQVHITFIACQTSLRLLIEMSG